MYALTGVILLVCAAVMIIAGAALMEMEKSGSNKPAFGLFYRSIALIGCALARSGFGGYMKNLKDEEKDTGIRNDRGTR
jgi:hypothetical protein